jgi:hypothetical protein
MQKEYVIISCISLLDEEDRDHFRIDKTLFDILSGSFEQENTNQDNINYHFILEDLFIKHKEDFTISIIGINLFND